MMKPYPRLSQSFAIWSSILLLLLLAIIILAYDLPFQKLKTDSPRPQLSEDFHSSAPGDVLLYTAENFLINNKYMDAWNTLLFAEDEYRKQSRLELLSRVHWMRAKMLHELREFDAALEEIERSATLAERLDLEEYKTESIYLMALNLYGRKEYASTYQLLESKLYDYDDIPSKHALHFHNLAGLSRESAGDLYEAEMHFLTALQFSKRLIPEQYGFLYGNLGHVFAQQGRLSEARQYLALDLEWSVRKQQLGSAASAAYLLAELMSRSTRKMDRQTALQYLHTADSLVLHTDLGGFKMPSDSLWWSIQRAGAQSAGVHNDSAITASRNALNQKRVKEDQRIAARNRFYADGRTQWQRHLASRNNRTQRSGQAASFAAGLILLCAIVLIKPHFI